MQSEVPEDPTLKPPERRFPLGTPIRIALVRDRGPRYAPTLVRQAEDVFAMFREEAATLDRETFWVVLLNGRNRVLGVNVVSVGTLTAALVHPRELFKAAILANAANLIIAHNHPSGDAEPSAEDHAITERLRQSGELLGIPVIDHVVVTAERFVSMAERGRW
jgi:DNA repair protein RadC